MCRLAKAVSSLPEGWPMAICLGVVATLALTAGVSMPLVFAVLIAGFLVDVAKDWLVHHYRVCGCRRHDTAARATASRGGGTRTREDR